jgi:hypothetical protein
LGSVLLFFFHRCLNDNFSPSRTPIVFILLPPPSLRLLAFTTRSCDVLNVSFRILLHTNMGISINFSSQNEAVDFELMALLGYSLTT